ncbi:unnamed protein product [Closterium sp. Yama58-4]|nr:unnamed protein product [Closterium sp. Yama58-4]
MHRTRLEFEFQTSLDAPLTRRDFSSQIPFPGFPSSCLSILSRSRHQKFNMINGLLIPGGGTDLVPGPFMSTVQLLLQWAKEANDQGDYFPVQATCMGFEAMAIVISEDPDLLELRRFSAYFSWMSPDLAQKVQELPLTMENHQVTCDCPALPHYLPTSRSLAGKVQQLLTMGTIRWVPVFRCPPPHSSRSSPHSTSFSPRASPYLGATPPDHGEPSAPSPHGEPSGMSCFPALPPSLPPLLRSFCSPAEKVQQLPLHTENHQVCPVFPPFPPLFPPFLRSFCSPAEKVQQLPLHTENHQVCPVFPPFPPLFPPFSAPFALRLKRCNSSSPWEPSGGFRFSAVLPRTRPAPPPTPPLSLRAPLRIWVQHPLTMENHQLPLHTENHQVFPVFPPFPPLFPPFSAPFALRLKRCNSSLSTRRTISSLSTRRTIRYVLFSRPSPLSSPLLRSFCSPAEKVQQLPLHTENHQLPLHTENHQVCPVFPPFPPLFPPFSAPFALRLKRCNSSSPWEPSGGFRFSAVLPRTRPAPPPTPPLSLRAPLRIWVQHPLTMENHQLPLHTENHQVFPVFPPFPPLFPPLLRSFCSPAEKVQQLPLHTENHQLPLHTENHQVCPVFPPFPPLFPPFSAPFALRLKSSLSTRRTIRYVLFSRPSPLSSPPSPAPFALRLKSSLSTRRTIRYVLFSRPSPLSSPPSPLLCSPAEKVRQLPLHTENHQVCPVFPPPFPPLFPPFSAPFALRLKRCNSSLSTRRTIRWVPVFRCPPPHSSRSSPHSTSFSLRAPLRIWVQHPLTMENHQLPLHTENHQVFPVFPPFPPLFPPFSAPFALRLKRCNSSLSTRRTIRYFLFSALPPSPPLLPPFSAPFALRLKRCNSSLSTRRTISSLSTRRTIRYVLFSRPSPSLPLPPLLRSFCSPAEKVRQLPLHTENHQVCPVFPPFPPSLPPLLRSRSFCSPAEKVRQLPLHTENHQVCPVFPPFPPLFPPFSAPFALRLKSSLSHGEPSGMSCFPALPPSLPPLPPLLLLSG